MEATDVEATEVALVQALLVAAAAAVKSTSQTFVMPSPSTFANPQEIRTDRFY